MDLVVEFKRDSKMKVMRRWRSNGKPLVKKLAAVSIFGVLPGAMIAPLVYSSPDFIYNKQNPSHKSLN